MTKLKDIDLDTDIRNYLLRDTQRTVEAKNNPTEFKSLLSDICDDLRLSSKDAKVRSTVVVLVNTFIDIPIENGYNYAFNGLPVNCVLEPYFVEGVMTDGSSGVMSWCTAYNHAIHTLCQMARDTRFTRLTAKNHRGYDRLG